MWINRTSHPTHLETVVEWALNEKISNIAIWGGDGTFSRAVQALHKFNKLEAVCLALVPVGTGNDFVRRVFSPRGKPWIDRLKANAIRMDRFDLGLIQGDFGDRIFVNNSGFGRTQTALGRSKPSSLRDIVNFTRKNLQVEWGTEKIRQYETFHSIFAIVFNGPYFNKGLHFARDISAQDGLLTAYFVTPKPVRRLLMKFSLGRLGTSLASPGDRRVDAEFINVESDEPLFIQADGEPVTPDGVRTIRYSVLPGALNLAVPQ